MEVKIGVESFELWYWRGSNYYTLDTLSENLVSGEVYICEESEGEKDDQKQDEWTQLL